MIKIVTFVTISFVTNVVMPKNAVYGFMMARISEVYLSTLSSIMKPYGIERYFMPLQYLAANSGKITQKDLAEALGRDKVSTMRMVDYLCEREFLMRKQDCSDRRCQLLEVTEKTIKLLPIIDQAVQQTNDILLEGFSEEEKQQYKNFMDKIYTTIQDLPEPEYIVQAFKRK